MQKRGKFINFAEIEWNMQYALLVWVMDTPAMHNVAHHVLDGVYRYRLDIIVLTIN